MSLASHHVEHDFLIIAPDQKGAGLGVRILDNALQFYPRLGITTIGLMAGLSVGGAVWAKFGFRPVDDSEWRATKRKIHDNSGEHQRRYTGPSPRRTSAPWMKRWTPFWARAPRWIRTPFGTLWTWTEGLARLRRCRGSRARLGGPAVAVLGGGGT